jgi:hypothetical protein
VITLFVGIKRWPSARSIFFVRLGVAAVAAQDQGSLEGIAFLPQLRLQFFDLAVQVSDPRAQCCLVQGTGHSVPFAPRNQSRNGEHHEVLAQMLLTN